jgi:hypothetical protein
VTSYSGRGVCSWPCFPASQFRPWLTPCRDHLPDDLCDNSRVAQDVRLPKSHYFPPFLDQVSDLLTIPPSVAGNLCDPIAGVVAALELGAKLAPVPTVPKIPVAEDNDPGGPKDHIRIANDTRDMLSISQSTRPQGATEQQFRAGVVFVVRPLASGRGVGRRAKSDKARRVPSSSLGCHYAHMIRERRSNQRASVAQIPARNRVWHTGSLLARMI